MKAYPQIEIAMYNRHENKSAIQKTVKWLQVIMPIVMRTQQMVADKISLKGTNEIITFCIN